MNPKIEAIQIVSSDRGALLDVHENDTIEIFTTDNQIYILTLSDACDILMPLLEKARSTNE